MREAAAIALLAIVGTLFMGAFTRLPWHTLAALGPIFGLSAYTLIGTGLVVVAGYMTPTAAVSATAVIVGAIATGRRRRPDRRTMAAVVLAVLAVAGVAAAVIVTAPTRLTPDSLQYVIVADLITEPGGIDAVPPTMLVKRGLTTSIIQTLGALDDQPYAATAMPVMVISGFAALAVAIWGALSDLGRSRPTVAVIVATTLAFALSSNRAVYDAFYINSHGVVMTAFLVIVAGSFLATRRGGWLLAVAVAAALMVPARPEGVLLAALGLLPTVTHTELKPLERVMVTIPMSITAIIWFGLGLWSRAPGERTMDPTDPVTGGIVIAVALAVLSAVAGHPALRRVIGWVPWMAVGAMIALITIGYRDDPELLLSSAAATARNLAGEGFWGVSWIVLALLVIGASLSDGFEGDRFFTIPVVGFGVMFWLLPYLREGPYRAGTGDSGNRILAHVFLAALAYVAIAAGAPREEEPPLNDRRARHEAAP